MGLNRGSPLLLILWPLQLAAAVSYLLLAGWLHTRWAQPASVSAGPDLRRTAPPQIGDQLGRTRSPQAGQWPGECGADPGCHPPTCLSLDSVAAAVVGHRSPLAGDAWVALIRRCALRLTLNWFIVAGGVCPSGAGPVPGGVGPCRTAACYCVRRLPQLRDCRSGLLMLLVASLSSGASPGAKSEVAAEVTP